MYFELQWAAGKINGVDTGVKLLDIDCFHIGYRAQALGMYTLAVDWLREALRLGSVDTTVDIPTVRTALMNSFGDVSCYEANVPFPSMPVLTENGGKFLSTTGCWNRRN